MQLKNLCSRESFILAGTVRERKESKGNFVNDIIIFETSDGEHRAPLFLRVPTAKDCPDGQVTAIPYGNEKGVRLFMPGTTDVVKILMINQ